MGIEVVASAHLAVTWSQLAYIQIKILSGNMAGNMQMVTSVV